MSIELDLIQNLTNLVKDIAEHAQRIEQRVISIESVIAPRTRWGNPFQDNDEDLPRI